MILLYSILISWGCMFNPSPVGAVETDCEALLRQAYQSMRQLGAEIPKGRTYYLDYSVAAVLRGQQNQAPKERARAWYTADFAIVKSPSVEIYQDESDYFAISHLDRQVIWATPSGHLGQQQRFQRFTALQDSLLANGEIISCEDTNLEGTPVKRLEWRCTTRGQTYLNVQSITYWINAEDNHLLKALIVYGPQGNIETYSLEIHEMDMDRQIVPLQPPLRTALLNAQGKLRRPYAAYTLKDIRKQ